MTLMPSILPLHTRRFVLREVCRDDEPAFVRYQTDTDFAAHYLPAEKGADHARTVFGQFLEWQAERPRRRFQLAVCHAADPSAMIGSSGVRLDSISHEAEFGIELSRQHWGRYGYAIEIAGAVINFAFEDLGVRILMAESALSNAAAARLARAAGFRPVFTDAKIQWRLEGPTWRAVREKAPWADMA
jgi:RimJ/RimL family protein N-acetyltransferase